MRSIRFGRFLLLLSVVLGGLLAGCGHSSNGSASTANPAKGSTWDQMEWDQGKWG